MVAPDGKKPLDGSESATTQVTTDAPDATFIYYTRRGAYKKIPYKLSLLLPIGFWSGDYSSCLGSMYDWGTCRHLHWVTSSVFVKAFLLSLVGNIRNDDPEACKIIYVVFIAIFVVSALAYLAVRPHRNRVDDGLAITLHALTALLCAILVWPDTFNGSINPVIVYLLVVYLGLAAVAWVVVLFICEKCWWEAAEEAVMEEDRLGASAKYEVVGLSVSRESEAVTEVVAEDTSMATTHPNAPPPDPEPPRPLSRLEVLVRAIDDII